MRIVALLNFFAERPDWLHDVVVSLPRAGVDQVVAADGAYALYPDGHASSGGESHAALCRAAQLAEIPLQLHVPDTLWAGNEVEKRTAMFRIGERYDPDWYLIVDADEVVIRAPEDLKARLSSTTCDCADVMSLEQNAPVIHSMAENADWPQIHYSRHVKPRRCLIRAVEGLVVGPRHLDYLTPDGRNLWGDEMGNPLRITDMMIDHRNRLRDPARTQAARDYYVQRTATGAEPGPVGALPPARPASPEKLKVLNDRLRRGIKNWAPA